MQYKPDQRKNRAKTPMLFIVKDMGTDLEDIRDDGFTSHELKEIAKHVFRPNHVMDPKRCQLKSVTDKIKPFKSLVQVDGFDIVSCQFALHYFFKNESYLDMFCQNVNTLLKPGGYFIGTCFSGDVVHDKLERLSNGDHIEGIIDDNVIWRVTKRYETFDETVGAAVDVYIESIGQSIQEYLVQMDVLKNKFEKYGIHIKEKDSMSFATTFDEDEYMRGAPEAVRELSSMYRCFVFEKRTVSGV